MSTSHNRYGPHDESTAPTHVVEVQVKRHGKTLLLRKPARLGQYPDAEVVDVLPAVLRRQHEQMNRIAHGDSLVGLRSSLCRVCARPEWQCLTMRRGQGDEHEYEPSR